jgi:hypothetical protein
MLHIADNFGGSVQLNPVQAMDLMDFLLRHAERIRKYMSTDALEAHAWNEFLKQNAVNGLAPMELSEAERLALLEPTPFDSGVCRCGKFVAAGRLHEHQCIERYRKAHEAWVEAINTPVCEERRKEQEREDEQLAREEF